MTSSGGGATRLFRSRGVVLMAVLSTASALAITIGGLLSSPALIALGLAMLACQVGIAGIVAISVAWKIATLTKKVAGASSKQLSAIQLLGRSPAPQQAQVESESSKRNALTGTTEQAQPGLMPTTENGIVQEHVAKDAGNSSPRVGRNAAAAATDEERAERLLKALAYSPPASAFARRPILVIGTSPLHCALENDFQVWKARGGLLSAMFKSADASAVIVEQRVFMEGPWFGGLSASGTMVYQEIAALLELARSKGVPTYLVPCAMPNDTFTSDLKLHADLVIGQSQDASDYGDDVGFPLIDALGRYVDTSEVSTHRKNAIGVEV